MNKTILAVLAVLMVAVLAMPAQAQFTNSYRSLLILGGAAADTSLNSVYDTTAVFKIGAYPMVNLEVSSADRVNITNIHVYQRQRGMTAWVLVDSVVAWAGSTNGVTNTKEFPLRDGAVNKLPGIASDYKLQIIYAGTNNDNARVYCRVHYGGM